MKKLNLKYIGLFIAAAAIVSCETEFENPIDEVDVYTSGEADFSNYVAIGNSLTSGYADGALYLDAQTKSFPAIMAGQMELAGGGEFIQPLVNDNAGGLLAAGVPIPGFGNRFVLASDGMGSPAGPAVYTGATPTTDITNTVTGKLNNYGVPGAKSFHLGAPGYGNIAGLLLGQANPYYVRFASSGTSTVIGDAVAANPSFFTLWIGNNDILSFATSGGSGVDQLGNLDPTTYGSNDITDPNVFAGAVNGYVTALTSNGAKGALINIPNVTSIPFFTTVPSNAIPLDAATAGQVMSNPAIQQYNGGLQAAAGAGAITADEAALRTINFTAGQNFMLMVDEDLTDLSGFGLPNLRQTNDTDLITFTSASVIGTQADPNDPLSVIGVAVPLGDENVLTSTEQTAISDAQNAYNTTLENIAAANDLVYVDAKAALAEVAAGGVSFNGGVLSSTYASGGAFSLDAVHPTPRGYAFTANVIIDAINEKYGSTIPKVEIGNYRSVQTSDLVN
ncbi:SGNH/GDSL hydrolase family protein [Nonlabens sp.]|uniref:SGNH/GDSL hydrolase family protein n=1 Tax=Nonlabens sp. TaxID=1888209 RepID=UPI003F69995C